jgi:Ca-activated chloride channel family protein
MLGNWGTVTRMTVAKKFLSDFVDSLRINEDLELALRVYGHQFPSRLQRCNDSKLEVPFGPMNHDRILQRLKAVVPQGTTPIAYSLEQAATDFPAGLDVRNIVIIITDGQESCEGDPCQVSINLQKRNIFLRPFIIGLGMDKNYQEQFGCMGKFFDATEIADFRNALHQAVYQTLDKTTLSVELLDENNSPIVSNINVSFVNNLTGKVVYDFVHYRDRNGKPDSVQIDAVIPYNIRVNTVPPVTLSGITIIPGKHNVISVKVPQGSLQISQKNTTEYKTPVNVLVKRKGSDEVINLQTIESIENYLSGTYDIELTTLPRLRLEGLVINPKKLTKIEIPPPGVANILVNFAGYGSIYSLDQDGNGAWLYDMDENSTRASLAIQPGAYRYVFRAKNSLGSKFTFIKDFIIESGKAISLGY